MNSNVSYTILNNESSSTEDEVKRIETRGRKSKLHIPSDVKYGTGYDQATKVMMKCECGAVMNKR